MHHRLASVLSITLGCTLCAALLASAPAARAQAAAETPKVISSDEARDIRSVIQAQLDAFAADDAESAFGQASPEIREMFGTPERFMSMVREQYPVVYRPVSVSFLPAEATPAGVIQGVRMQDANGIQWLAAYLMQLQGDKSWRIGGCQLVFEGKGLTT